MSEIILRSALFVGLALHKMVWEIMKRERPASQRRTARRPVLRVVKLTKIALLGFLIIQTLFLSVLPISNSPVGIRAFGILLFITGLSTALAGRITLGRNWSDIENPTLGVGHQVVSSGIYQFIRHPIYAGDVLMITGLELSLNSWLVLGVVPLVGYVIYQTTREETQLLRSLPGYDTYRARTKRFVPFIV